MNPALKLYLDKLHAETRAQYAEIHKQLQLQEALFSKFDTGASTPQPAHSPVVASDGGLSIDAADAAVLPEVSSSTTKAQDVLEVIHDASPGYITMAPVTCSTDCSNQVVATDIVNEVHDVNEVRDATTAIFPELAIDPNGKAVKQPTPAISATAVTPSWLVLRLKPWPPFCGDHAEGTKVRPIPWPSFPMGKFMEHPYVIIQWHGIELNSSSIPKIWPPRVKYMEINLLAIDSTARCLEFKRSTLHSLGITLVDNVLICNELQLSSTQHGMGLPFLLPKPPWPFPIPTTSYSLFNAVCWRFYYFDILCSYDISSSVSTLSYCTEKHSPNIDMLPCFHSEPMSCEVNPSGWYLAIPSLLVVQTVQIAAEHHDTKFSSFASAVLLFGYEKWFPWTPHTTSKDLNFLPPKSNSRGLLLIELEQCTNTSSYGIKPGLHHLCVSTSRALMVLLFEWPLFSCTFGTDTKMPWPPPEGLLSTQSLMQRWVFVISASVWADAWLNVRFNGRNCGTTDTALGLLKLYVDSGTSLQRKSLPPIFEVCTHLTMKMQHLVVVVKIKPGLCLELQLLALVAMHNAAVPCLVFQYAPLKYSHNAVKRKEFTSNILLCFGNHLVGNILNLIRLEPFATQSGEHLPLLQPKSPWSALIPTNFATEFRSNLRTNSESLHITGVLLELPQFWVATYEFHDQDAQPTFGFSQKNAQLKLPGSSFSCTCRAVQFLVVHEPVIELAGSCSLAKLWSTSYLGSTTQQWKIYENHILEHPAVCSIPSPHNLQQTMQILNMLVQWQFLSQEEFKGSGRALLSFHIEFYTTSMVLLPRDTTQWQSWPPPPNKHGTVPVHKKFPWFHSWLGSLLFGDDPSLKALFGCHITITLLMDKHTGLPQGGDTCYANWCHWKITKKLCANIWDSKNMLSNPQSVSVINIAEIVDSAVIYMFTKLYTRSSSEENYACPGAISWCSTSNLPCQLIPVIGLYVTHNFYMASACVQVTLHEGRDVRYSAASLDQVLNCGDYYLSHGHFSDLHLTNGYYHDNYHGDPYMIKDLQAPWDPGELFVTAAWGQAAFQEGRDVRDLPYTYSYVGLPVVSTWAGPGCASSIAAGYKYLERKQRGTHPSWIRHGTDGSFFSHLRLSPLFPLHAAISYLEAL